MNLRPDNSFDNDYARLPTPIQKRVDKKLTLFVQNPRHPSLRVKKMEGHEDIWEGRISDDYRFTFRIVGETYWLRHVGPHDILKNP